MTISYKSYQSSNESEFCFNCVFFLYSTVNLFRFGFLLGVGWARTPITPFVWREVHPFELEIGAVYLGGGNSNICLFSPRTLGKIPMLTNMFQVGWFNHQPVMKKFQPRLFCWLFPLMCRCCMLKLGKREGGMVLKNKWSSISSKMFSFQQFVYMINILANMEEDGVTSKV